jgi:hypothetical protein
MLPPFLGQRFLYKFIILFFPSKIKGVFKLFLPFSENIFQIPCEQIKKEKSRMKPIFGSILLILTEIFLDGKEGIEAYGAVKKPTDPPDHRAVYEGKHHRPHPDAAENTEAEKDKGEDDRERGTRKVIPELEAPLRK